MRAVKSIKKIPASGLWLLRLELLGGGSYISKLASSESHADKMIEKIESKGFIHLDAIRFHWK